MSDWTFWSNVGVALRAVVELAGRAGTVQVAITAPSGREILAGILKQSQCVVCVAAMLTYPALEQHSSG